LVNFFLSSVAALSHSVYPFVLSLISRFLLSYSFLPIARIRSVSSHLVPRDEQSVEFQRNQEGSETSRNLVAKVLNQSGARKLLFSLFPLLFTSLLCFNFWRCLKYQNGSSKHL